ncbi:MAG TPA: twitch domain-containing radical SAM protein [Elusimicrobiota bacterium]|nr:twitch domain-containing radical SAM protein [Elusimicrobiota bacterium]
MTQPQESGDALKQAAIEEISRAAKADDPRACVILGRLYLSGESVPADAQEARRWYERAARLNFPDAQKALGDLYRNGNGVEQSFSTAFKWYRRCAPADRKERLAYYAETFALFGNHCRYGIAVPIDDARAARWYGRAARLGHAKTQGILGDLYLDGKGVEKDIEKARFWYLKASERMNIQAMDRLFSDGNEAFKNHPVDAASALHEAKLWYQYALLKSGARSAPAPDEMDKQSPRWTQRAAQRLRDSKVFCILPWMHLSAWPDGNVYPCCATWKAPPLGNLKKDSLPELWNSESERQLRLNMLRGERSSACSRCYEAESHGSPSQRQRMNKNFPHRYGLAEHTKPDGTVEPFKLFYLDFRFSNVCNFRCRMCGPIFSSSWHADYAALTGKQSETMALLRPGESDALWTQIEKLLPDLEEIYFAGGEPLLMEEHFRILDFLVKRKLFHVRLLYSTNFSMTHFQDHDIFALWDKFETVHVGASIDAMGRRGEYIRKGQKWEDILANREHMARVCPRAQLNLISTLSALNSLCLPDLQKDWLEKGYVLAKNMVINLVMTPEHYQLQILPPSLKERVREKYARHIETVLAPFGHEASAAVDYINGAVEFMMARDLPEERLRFQEITAKLDALRGERFADVFPELRELAD